MSDDNESRPEEAKRDSQDSTGVSGDQVALKVAEMHVAEMVADAVASSEAHRQHLLQQQPEKEKAASEPPDDQLLLIDLNSYAEGWLITGDGAGGDCRKDGEEMVRGRQLLERSEPEEGDDDVFVGEGTVDSSVTSAARVCCSLSEQSVRGMEDDVALEGLFRSCVCNAEGEVLVSHLVQRLRSFIVVSDESVSQYLDDLWCIFVGPTLIDTHVDLDTYCRGMQEWVRRLRHPTPPPPSALAATAATLAILTSSPSKRGESVAAVDDQQQQHVSSLSSFVPGASSSFSGSSSSNGILDMSELNNSANDVVVEGAPENLSILDNNELCHKICEERFRVKKLHEQLQTVRVQASSAEDQNNALLNEKELMHKRLHRLEKEALKGREVEQENLEIREYLLKSKEKLRVFKRTNADLHKDNARLEASLKSLNEDMRTANNQMEQLKLCNDNMVETVTLQKAMERNRELEIWLDERKSIIDSLREEKHNLEQQLIQAQEEIASLQQGLHRLALSEGGHKRRTDDMLDLTIESDGVRSPSTSYYSPGLLTSKRQRTSLPSATNSIFMELRPWVEQDLHLPSPFCERQTPTRGPRSLGDLSAKYGMSHRVYASNQPNWKTRGKKLFTAQTEPCTAGCCDAACALGCGAATSIEGDEGLGSREDDSEEDAAKDLDYDYGHDEKEDLDERVGRRLRRLGAQCQAHAQRNRYWETRMSQMSVELKGLEWDADQLLRALTTCPRHGHLNTPTRRHQRTCGCDATTRSSRNCSGQSTANTTLNHQLDATMMSGCAVRRRNSADSLTSIQHSSDARRSPAVGQGWSDEVTVTSQPDDVIQQVQRVRVQLASSLATLGALLASPSGGTTSCSPQSPPQPAGYGDVRVRGLTTKSTSYSCLASLAPPWSWQGGEGGVSTGLMGSGRWRSLPTLLTATQSATTLTKAASSPHLLVESGCGSCVYLKRMGASHVSHGATFLLACARHPWSRQSVTESQLTSTIEAKWRRTEMAGWAAAATTDHPDCGDDDQALPRLNDEWLARLHLSVTGQRERFDQMDAQLVQRKFDEMMTVCGEDKMTLTARPAQHERRTQLARHQLADQIGRLTLTLNHVLLSQEGGGSGQLEWRWRLAQLLGQVEVVTRCADELVSRAQLHGSVIQEERLSGVLELVMAHVQNVRRQHDQLLSQLALARQSNVESGQSPLRSSCGAAPYSLVRGKLGATGATYPVRRRASDTDLLHSAFCRGCPVRTDPVDGQGEAGDAGSRPQEQLQRGTVYNFNWFERTKIAGLLALTQLGSTPGHKGSTQDNALSIRWLLAVLLLLCAGFYLSMSFQRHSDTCSSSSGGYSLDEIIRPFLTLRHYGPPPV